MYRLVFLIRNFPVSTSAVLEKAKTPCITLFLRVGQNVSLAGCPRKPKIANFSVRSLPLS